MTSVHDIFTTFGPEYLQRYATAMPMTHRKVIDAITACRTEACGIALYQCDSCAEPRQFYRSCGNRHCPTCQYTKTQQWLDKQFKRQLPGHHFLITFTVPEPLRSFMRQNQRVGYAALFKASSDAIKKLALDRKHIGADLPGFFGVLHILRLVSGQTFYDTCQAPCLFFLRLLADCLSRDIGEVIVFIVRFMITPHDKKNLQPLRCQSPKRLGMTMSFRPLVAVIFVRPLTSIERVKGKPVRGVAQQFVTGKSKLYHTALATRFSYRDPARFGLKMPKGFPSIFGIAQFSPDHRHYRSTFSSRQRLDPLSGRRKISR